MLWGKYSGTENWTFFTSSAKVGNDDIKGGKFWITFWQQSMFWKYLQFEYLCHLLHYWQLQPMFSNSNSSGDVDLSALLSL